MSFTRRYFTWLLVPPAVLILPVAFAFLLQVVQMSTAQLLLLVVMLGVLYVAGAAVIYNGLAPHVDEIERGLEGKSDDISAAMTAVLDKELRLATMGWIVGGAAFAILGCVFVMPTRLGLGYFAIGTAIAVFFSIAWGYFVTKHQLSTIAAHTGARVRYRGRGVSLALKISLIFIGSFIVSSAALVELISSKVSTTLEVLAINSSSDHFDSVYGIASSLTKVDQAAINNVATSIPKEYTVQYVAPNGSMLSSGDALTESEVKEIRRIRAGDSSSYVGPHVSRFAPLPNNGILVLSIPWEPYAKIPFQIAFYAAVVAFLTVLVFSVATWFLTRDVIQPLRQLSRLSSELASGNFEAKARVFSDDELGALAMSFAETRDNLRGLLARVGGSGATITNGVGVITGGTESLLTRSREQATLTENSTKAVDIVRNGISRVVTAADGVADLTQDASARSLEMQASSEQIARSMDHLFQSVEKTSSSTTEMNASAAEMSTRAETLARIGDDVLSFVTQMDSTIAELRSTAQQTAELSRHAREDAEAGGDAMMKTVIGISESQQVAESTSLALEGLNKSVGEISQILNVIEEITNRTNLLALNAAIIAAQAGEHGAGFTVVADEIRQLADRTRGSTKEIGTIIKTVQTGSREAVAKMNESVERVQDNVRLAEDAATSLEKIVASATSSFEMATQISRALEDQAQATRHLHDVTSRMSDHIAEIARATREQARGTELLAQESELVREIAGQVKGATQEQSSAGRGITEALERIADDARAMRDLLGMQLRETDRIADASKVMLDIAQKNDAVAREFNDAVQTLVVSGREFETEVSRFRFGA